MTSTEERTWREPVQERSRRRFDEILAAASDELAASGYERLSLDAVARRAGSSVGSVYRYFPDKNSLIAAFLQRRDEELARVVASAFDDESAPFEEVVLAAAERYERVVRSSPGLMAIAAASLVNRDARRLFRASLDPIEEGVDRALATRLPSLSTERRRTAAAVVVRVTESLMTLTATDSDVDRHRVIAEMRVLLRGYATELAGSGRG